MFDKFAMTELVRNMNSCAVAGYRSRDEEVERLRARIVELEATLATMTQRLAELAEAWRKECV